LLLLVCDTSIKYMVRIVVNKVASGSLYLLLCHANIYLLISTFFNVDLKNKNKSTK
jgi:hypothetical protein